MLIVYFLYFPSFMCRTDSEDEQERHSTGMTVIFPFIRDLILLITRSKIL